MEGTGGVSATPSREPLVVSPPSRLQGSPKLSKYGMLLFPWLCTTIFLVVVILFVKIFEQKNVLTPTQKNTFNLISTGLIVLLSLSFYVSMNWFWKRTLSCVWLATRNVSKAAQNHFSRVLLVGLTCHQRLHARPKALIVYLLSQVYFFIMWAGAFGYSVRHG